VGQIIGVCGLPRWAFSPRKVMKARHTVFDPAEFNRQSCSFNISAADEC